VGHVAGMGEGRGFYRVLLGLRGRPRSRWEDNNLDLRKLGFDGAKRIRLAQDRL
jgi:hypothetical protein